MLVLYVLLDVVLASKDSICGEDKNGICNIIVLLVFYVTYQKQARQCIECKILDIIRFRSEGHCRVNSRLTILDSQACLHFHGSIRFEFMWERYPDQMRLITLL
jgi:hypothetical protein